MDSREVLLNTVKKYSDYILNNKEVDVAKLAGKRVAITGATGLIGSSVVLTLVEISKHLECPIKVVAVVRNRAKAEALFGDSVEYAICDVTDKIEISGEVDYIVHGANQTSSKAFMEEPVETINTALKGTTNILNVAKEKNVSSLVFLSTMEVYGAPKTDEKIDELHSSDLNTMSPRNSYPESKRMCESLCASYFSEYGVPVRVIRLTQTFGPGVNYNDGRVFAEFARNAIEGNDIVLHTKGETKRNYLFTGDAVSAIVTVLLNGENGNAYNAANEDTYCSIYEMAELVSKVSANDIAVRIEIDDESKFGYAPVLHMNLDTAKLRSIGWSPLTGLEEMYQQLISYMSEQNKEI
ncbi:Nucleoside-diphosphate-sugar epimerase [Pseudobutyrivibrio sp. UC1225]|uniref:NAD-dependent epimerase/dehydratase family protein n=1 Tax=Pseudobutyrivibrio sp. UC1225 TaxID=1798185 RepID=UPI0008ED4252|nr:NAD(P)-dependent oxidoreductase [Pseudobutyrivibrio sp. UC1225]SFO26579.1 Nucleoside-diphosphate-sugar epimerase [Pseudobutyrivibrio sp. UC1225]